MNNDYFKDLNTGWQDEDDRREPVKVYLELDDVLKYRGQKFHYHYKERDWGIRPEDGPAPSKRCCVIEVDRKDVQLKAKDASVCSVVWGADFAQAIERLKTILDWYFEIKDMTREELDQWRK